LIATKGQQLPDPLLDFNFIKEALKLIGSDISTQQRPDSSQDSPINDLNKLQTALSSFARTTGGQLKNQAPFFREISYVKHYLPDQLLRDIFSFDDSSRKQFGYTMTLVDLNLPDKFYPLSKRGLGSFSNVYYAVVPNNFRDPLAAVKMLKLDRPLQGAFWGNSNEEHTKAIRLMKRRELRILHLFKNCQHIAGLAVDDDTLPFDCIVLQPISCTWKEVLQECAGPIRTWFLVEFGTELFHFLLIFTFLLFYFFNLQTHTKKHIYTSRKCVNQGRFRKEKFGRVI
jgi:hypothetical protein